MAEDSRVLPDLKDIETKMGRKVPESLVRSLAAGKRHEEREKSATSSSCKRCSKSADVERLEGKLLFLRQEMVRIPGNNRCNNERTTADLRSFVQVHRKLRKLHFVLMCMKFRDNCLISGFATILFKISSN